MPAADSFLQVVLRSGLLDSEQLEEAVRAAPPVHRDNPEALAEHLIKVGKLSRFQASKLLKGAFVGLVLGPYQVLSPLGRGGMGTVYLARDSRTRKLVALKALSPKKAREEDRMLARFRREMILSRQVSHPNLAEAYEAGVSQDVYYIAMEYIPGRNLYRLVTDDGPLAMPRVARLFAEVAHGLDHAHLRGLIHRDLKPSNIIITPNDHAKVLDLGLALIQGEIITDRTVMGGQGYVVGTFDYLAPEQAEDAAKVDSRCDVYSLGCTLYFALTGRPPFPGGSAQEKVNRHRHEEPPSVEQLNPRVPLGLASLIRKMMAKTPELRPQSADAVRTELMPWSTGEPVLPLDEKEDAKYQQAVREIETSSGWEELTAEGDSIVSPRGRPHSSGVSHFLGRWAVRPDSPWASWMPLLGIVSLILASLALFAVLYLLAK
jgi:serine/threonine protein kinase